MDKQTISKFRYENLRNEAHVEFNETYLGVVDRHEPEELKIKPQFDEYKRLFVIEVDSLDIVRKSEYTVEIEAQNNVRNKTFRSMVNAVKSGVDHFNASKQAAAKRINVVLLRYGNIATKPLDEETAAIEDLIRELNDNHSADVSTLELAEFLTQLNLQNVRFKELMNERYDEMTQRPQVRMKEARRDVDKALREMLDMVEALVKVDGYAKYEALIVALNVIAERYRNQLAQSAGRRKTNVKTN
ncbi:MAG: DUF6261 family protein [Prevotellaceae bacterium]|jgi:hypothetical protein|nr:DUF6261 family protein [Prevotellaceae bacterium]